MGMPLRVKRLHVRETYASNMSIRFDGQSSLEFRVASVCGRLPFRVKR